MYQYLSLLIKEVSTLLLVLIHLFTPYFLNGKGENNISAATSKTHEKTELRINNVYLTIGSWDEFLKNKQIEIYSNRIMALTALSWFKIEHNRIQWKHNPKLISKSYTSNICVAPSRRENSFALKPQLHLFSQFSQTSRWASWTKSTHRTQWYQSAQRTRKMQ